MEKIKVSLIDLGSNSTRMYIAEIYADKTYKILSRHRVMTRLSQGMGDEKVLKEMPINRTITVLKEFAKKSKEAETMIIATATAAVRLATNGEDFCKKVLEETGINLITISGEKEAELDFKGVMFGISQIENCLITDTGGGSTELILVKEREIVSKTSIPFGAVSLREKYKSVEDAKDIILKTISEKAEFINEAKEIPVIGIGGSISALAIFDLNYMKKEEKIKEINGYSFEKKYLAQVLSVIEKMTKEELLEAGVEKERSETFAYGILPTCILVEYLNSPELFVSTFGLREGIISVIADEYESFNMKNMELFLKG